MAQLINAIVMVLFGFVSEIVAGFGNQNNSLRKAGVDLPTRPQQDVSGNPQGHTHDYGVWTVVIVIASGFGVAAVVLTTYGLYRRLHSLPKQPEIVEMETMLHV